MTTSNSLSFDELNAQLIQLANQTRVALDSGNYETAETLIHQVLALVPNHQVALMDLAFVKYRQQNYVAAYDYLMQVLQHHGQNTDPNAYDSLVNVCIGLNRREEALYYAKHSIKLKKQQSQGQYIFPLPHKTAPGLSSDPTRNIISYSLFGSSPRYCETAVINAKLAKQIYPEWTCRFYIDDTVPEDVVARLRAEQAQVLFVTETQRQTSGLFWRFAVIDDPNVQCFIIRDTDSLLSNKERAAVNDWLESGKWFHIMRDDVCHSELILAGMWGGYTGIFKDMQALILQLLNEVKVQRNTIDQVFLRQKLYPTVVQSVLQHDNVHLEPESQPYPDYELSEVEKTPYFHIGMVDAHVLTIDLTIDDKQAKRVRWWLVDRSENIICSYENDVLPTHQVKVNLPYCYALKIQSGEYLFKNRTIA